MMLVRVCEWLCVKLIHSRKVYPNTFSPFSLQFSHRLCKQDRPIERGSGGGWAHFYPSPPLIIPQSSPSAHLCKKKIIREAGMRKIEWLEVLIKSHYKIK